MGRIENLLIIGVSVFFLSFPFDSLINPRECWKLFAVSQRSFEETLIRGSSVNLPSPAHDLRLSFPLCFVLPGEVARGLDRNNSPRERTSPKEVNSTANTLVKIH